ncbi:MAG: hypothetical protein JSW28_03005 [Thermoplasmata archaeon]|nr:MAG: hypothetical protein JSW28_03005 [Thermoplasmata archaeon]
MRGKVYVNLITIIILTTLLFTSMSNTAAGAEIEGIETNITDDELSQGYPAIYGDKIVWSERHSENGNTYWEIYLYDLALDSNKDGLPNYLENSSTGGKPDPDPAKIRLTHNISNKFYPQIYEDTIVWEDNRFGSFDIYMYDLSEDTDSDGIPNYLDLDDDGDDTLDENDQDYDPAEKRITDNPADQEKPAVYGDKIVWQDSRYGNKDVFIYDSISDKEAMIGGYNETGWSYETSGGITKWRFPFQINPKIYGDKVVWEDERYTGKGDIEIVMYNLSVDSDGDGVPNYLDSRLQEDDPAEVRITTNSASDFKPSIHGNLIAYTRSDNVYLYNIVTGTEHRVTNSTSEQKIELKLCNIHSTKIVFSYGINDEYYIRLYDLLVDSDGDDVPNYMDSDTESPDPALSNITDVPLIHSSPVIYTNRIVWQDNRNRTSYDVYIFTMTENHPPEIVQSSPEYSPYLMEGESLEFNVSAEDNDTDTLTYSWYLDNMRLPNENESQYEFFSGIHGVGSHTIRAVVSDGEFWVERIWQLYTTASDIEPLEITEIVPETNPVINEGKKITLKVGVSFLGTGELDYSWQYDGPQSLLRTYNDNVSQIEVPLDYNSSNEIQHGNVTVTVSNGTVNASHTWQLTIMYFAEADLDGYPDDVEVEWHFDALDVTSTPPDLDGDYIVDGDDDDKDGDGVLDKHDAYPLDPERHEGKERDYTVEIIFIIITIILILVAGAVIPRLRKSSNK